MCRDLIVPFEHIVFEMLFRNPCCDWNKVFGYVLLTFSVERKASDIIYVISICMIYNAMVSDEVTQGKNVGIIKNGVHNKALVNSNINKSGSTIEPTKGIERDWPLGK